MKGRLQILAITSASFCFRTRQGQILCSLCMQMGKRCQPASHVQNTHTAITNTTLSEREGETELALCKLYHAYRLRLVVWTQHVSQRRNLGVHNRSCQTLAFRHWRCHHHCQNWKSGCLGDNIGLYVGMLAQTLSAHNLIRLVCIQYHDLLPLTTSLLRLLLYRSRHATDAPYLRVCSMYAFTGSWFFAMQRLRDNMDLNTACLLATWKFMILPYAQHGEIEQAALPAHLTIEGACHWLRCVLVLYQYALPPR